MRCPVTHADIHEPDRRVDELIDFVEAAREPGLAQWAVEAVAGGLGVDAVVVQGDGQEDQLEALGEALGGRLALALDGGSGDDRLGIVGAVLAGFLRGFRGR